MTTNARSVVAVTVFSVVCDSTWPPGSTFDVDDVRAVDARRRAAASSRPLQPRQEQRHRALGRQVAVRRRSSSRAPTTPLTPWRFSSARGGLAEEVVPDDVAREQPVGLLPRGLPPRPSPSTSGFAANVSARPCDAADAQLQRLDHAAGSRRAAGRATSSFCAAATFWRSCCGDPVQCARESRRLDAGRDQRVRDRGAVLLASCARSSRPCPCSSCRSRASTSTRTTGSASPKKTSAATTIASSASRRRTGVRLRGRAARAAHPRAAAAPARQAHAASPEPPSSAARLRRSRTGCRRRAGP